MTLWAFIPGKHLEAIGSLPQSARRRDTGELVNDLRGTGIIWAHAAGYWNLDTILTEVDELARINKLTLPDLHVLREEVEQALAERTQRHDYVDDARTAWAAAKDQGQDRIDLIPPYTRPTGRPTGGVTQANVPAWIAYLEANDQYLDDWIRFLQRSLIGGGTIQSPGIGDVLVVVAQAVAELLDASAGVVIPDAPDPDPEEP